MATTKNPKLNEIGEAGTIIYNGVIDSPDPNRDLVGHMALDTYDKMRLGDPVVKAALRAVMLPLLSSTLRVDPASESAQDKEVAQWVEKQLTGMTRPFADFLREALVFLPLGHYVFEIVYEIKKDGSIGLRKLAPRLPRTILAWQTEDGKDGITQLKTDGQIVSIPIERLLVFVNEKEGDNWEGVSLLRNAYKPWYMKENLEKIDAVAHERSGVGIPKARPNGNPQQADKDQAITTLKNLRAGEESYVFEPAGWEIEFMQLAGSQGRSPIDSMQYHQFGILLSVLAAFLNLGSGENGSKALSADLSDFFEMSLQFTADTLVASPINKFLVERLVDLNYSVEEYPKVRLDGIGKVDFTAITEALAKMTGSHVYTPMLKDENFMRRAMGMPEAPDNTYYPDPSEKPDPVVADASDSSSDGGKVQERKVTKEVKELQASQDAFLSHYVEREAEAIRLALGKPQDAV